MAEPLPQPRTRFIGRRRSLTRVRALLGDHRLVTLTGAGGSGKTRLALRVLEEGGRALADEVGWIALEELEDPRLVAGELCSVLGVRLAAGVPPLDGLIHRLRASRALLALDNCEHLVDACARIVEAILDGCPEVRVLATSREPLGVTGEVRWLVPPLSLPVPAGRGGPLAAARESEAVRLFVDRARGARPDFDVAPANLGAVVRVCRQLEGIPLALELAAARVRVLAVEQIADRLESGLALLSRDGRQGPRRHRTMRAALAWSHDLLSEPERALFRRMGAFGGPASLEACEAVGAGGEVDGSTILDRLTGLVDRSLVVVEDGRESARYRLLEPVRRYAVERLEASGERAAVGGRHAAHYLALAEARASDLHGADRPAALDRLEAEHGNLRRAWDHALERGDAETLARLARSLFWFWNFGSHFTEGRTRSEEALSRLARDSAARADLLYTAGTLAWMQSQYDVAGSHLEACVTRCRTEGRGDLLPAALRELAGVSLVRGDLPAAAELYEESVQCLRDTEDPWGLALALVMLADVREGLGVPDTARELREEARRLFRRMEDPWGISLASFGLAVGAARDGDLDAARVQAREALALQRAAGDDWNVAQDLALLGEIEQRAGHLDRAAELLLGSLEAFQRVGDRTSIGHVLLVLAQVERERGRTDRALRLAGAGQAQAEKVGGSYPYGLASDDERRQGVAALRRAAGEETFAEEWAAGRSMSLDAAVELALAGGEPPPPPVPAVEGGVRLRILGLGPPDVYRGRRRLRPADWTYALPRELLFNLLLHGPRTREQIGLDLWPEASREQLRGRFRTALYHLRRALGGTEWVRYENGRYAFDRSLDYWFDVEEFESCLDEAARLMDADPVAAADRLERALDVYRGELLEGEAPGDWSLAPQDRLRRRYLDALRLLAGLRMAEGAHHLAAELYRRLVACDGLDEGARRGLACALALGGERGAALRHLDELAELLRRELDAPPSHATVRLRARLERGEAPIVP